jgi:hypothetical protein
MNYVDDASYMEVLYGWGEGARETSRVTRWFLVERRSP